MRLTMIIHGQTVAAQHYYVVIGCDGHPHKPKGPRLFSPCYTSCPGEATTETAASRAQGASFVN